MKEFWIDKLTQIWVKTTGKRIKISEHPWLKAISGPPDFIGFDVFENFAKDHQLQEITSQPLGILPNFSLLDGPLFKSSGIAQDVVSFYESTSAYHLNAWSQWCSFYRPFGWMLSKIFSLRLQQLNVPLTGLDTSLGMTNQVRSWHGEHERLTVWLRKLNKSGNVLYSGSYSICSVPGHPNPCVKVAFPLPNGYCLVIMKPEDVQDGRLKLTSSGHQFGDPGFYFVVQEGGITWAKYIRTLKETITVYSSENGEARADHSLKIFGTNFLNLHYYMTRKEAMS